MQRRTIGVVLAAGLLFTGGLALAAGVPGIPGAFQPYKRWHKVNGKPIPPTPTTAHSAPLKNVYASRLPVRGRYPYGTLIVKEGFDASGFVSLIATMRKARGADPRHGDWKFVEWSRSRRGERFAEVARDGVCWSCHQLARKRDWVFTRG